ncbi:uncharacterized protein [Drosophila tropicalis]|uniref:uncharacterized protein n=1 Tax=Drosophila tropicalis TaxID=46794 RepID=UPI0035ABD14B
MENSKTEKSADTRKSGPELGGSNGALKALAKNVANQLKLDRPEMKRVVAKVVAERHGLGDVADHKGFMYYVKPDRIDMNQLISQSKEAFDGMMQQQRHRETLPQQQRKAPAKVGESRRTLSGGGANKKKKAVSRKSSTAVFQLQDWGRKSLNGVIIDQTHLPRGGKEILLSVNRRMVAMGAASSKKKKETKMPAAVPVRKPLRMQKFIAMKSSSSSRVPPLLKKSSVRKIPAKGANPRAPKVVDSSSSTLKGESYRLPAGSSFHPPPANPIESDTKKPLAGSKSKTSINPKQTVQCQRNYEKPWLVSRHKRHPRLKTEDGAAAAVGAIRAGRAGGAGGDAEGQSQSSGSKLPAHPSKRTQALNRPRTRANYLTPRGTGATKQKLKKSS